MCPWGAGPRLNTLNQQPLLQGAARVGRDDSPRKPLTEGETSEVFFSARGSSDQLTLLGGSVRIRG